MNTNAWILGTLVVALGMFLVPSVTIVILLFGGLYVFFNVKNEINDEE